MSNQHLQHTYNLTGLKGSEKYVLVTLSYLADEDGYCMTSAKELREVMGSNEQVIRESFYALEALGHIKLLAPMDEQPNGTKEYQLFPHMKSYTPPTDHLGQAFNGWIAEAMP